MTTECTVQPALVAVADVADVVGVSVAGVLDAADELVTRRQQLDVDLVLIVQEFARRSDASSVDPTEAQLPGRERAVQVGGEGTPRVAEFAPAMLAARLELSPYAGRMLIADVLDLSCRLPLLNHGVLDGRVRLAQARLVAQKTRHLTREAARQVDATVEEVADGRLAWSRFEAAVDAAVIATDLEGAAEAEERARREVFAKPTRSNEHGMRGFYIKADAATIARIDATVAFLATCLRFLGDARNLNARRVTAVLLMANPMAAVRLLKTFRERVAALDLDDRTREEAGAHTDTNGGAHDDVVDPEPFHPNADLPEIEGLDWAKLLPSVSMSVHLAHTGDGAGDLARVEGLNPVTTDWVRTVLGERAKFKITPVLDPLGQIPVDAYEIPARLRHATHLLTPADVFPFASGVTRDVQLDHTVPYVWPDPHTDEAGPPGPDRDRQPRPHDRLPPPHQDPLRLGPPTTLPRHLPLARPPRRVLPRRPHRHPPTPTRRRLRLRRLIAPRAVPG